LPVDVIHEPEMPEELWCIWREFDHEQCSRAIRRWKRIEDELTRISKISPQISKASLRRQVDVWREAKMYQVQCFLRALADIAGSNATSRQSSIDLRRRLARTSTCLVQRDKSKADSYVWAAGAAVHLGNVPIHTSPINLQQGDNFIEINEEKGGVKRRQLCDRICKSCVRYHQRSIEVWKKSEYQDELHDRILGRFLKQEAAYFPDDYVVKPGNFMKGIAKMRARLKLKMSGLDRSEET
jgi:hypothetical protein